MISVSHLLFVALAATVLSACGSSPLLDDINQVVQKAKLVVSKPTITPAGGVYRNVLPSNATLVPSSKAQLLYTLDGSQPLFNTLGEAQPPTNKSGASVVLAPFPVPSSRTVRALSWKDGKVSGETKVTYNLVGDGGTVWSASLNPKKQGVTYATAIGTDGSRYTGGQVDNGSGVLQAFITSWDAKGNVLWSKRLLSTSPTAPSRINSIAVDSAGTVYAVGTMETSAKYYFGASTDTLGVPYLHAGAFLVSFDSDGNWTKAVVAQSGANTISMNGIALDSSTGLVFVVGSTSIGDHDVKPTAAIVSSTPGVAATAPSGQPPVFAKTGAAGFLWKFSLSLILLGTAECISTYTADDSFTSVAWDPTVGEIIVGGQYATTTTDPLDYGPPGPTLTSDIGYTLPMVIAYDDNLNPQWQIGATAGHVAGDTPATLYGRVNAVAVASSGTVAAGGVQSPAGRVWTWGGVGINGSSASGSGFLVAIVGGTSAASMAVSNTVTSSVQGLSVDINNYFYASGYAGQSAFAFKINQNLTSTSWWRYHATTGTEAYYSISHSPTAAGPDRVLVGGTTGTLDLSAELFD